MHGFDDKRVEFPYANISDVFVVIDLGNFSPLFLQRIFECVQRVDAAVWISISGDLESGIIVS